MQQVCLVQISRLALLLEVLQLLQHVRWMSLKHEGKSRFLLLFKASSIIYSYIFITQVPHCELKLRVTHSVSLVPNPANIYYRNLHIVWLICGALISEMAGNDLLKFHVNSLPLC